MMTLIGEVRHDKDRTRNSIAIGYFGEGHEYSPSHSFCFEYGARLGGRQTRCDYGNSPMEGAADQGILHPPRRRRGGIYGNFSMHVTRFRDVEGP